MSRSFHMSYRLFLTSLTIGTLALSACATKPDRRGPPSERGGQGQGPQRSAGTFVKPIGLLFATMDQNNDAVISRAELERGIQNEWSQFDRNPSGTDFAMWSITKLGSTDAYPTFMMFDRDFNSVVSEDEFSERLNVTFRQLDKNGDGNVERSEMLVSFAAPRGEKKQKGRNSGEKRGGGGGGGGRPPR